MRRLKSVTILYGTNFYRNGNWKYMAVRINNLLNGVVCWFHDNGQIEHTTTYVNGMEPADRYHFYRNGTLEYIYRCVDAKIRWRYVNGI